jgi:cyanophycin synthetase
MEIRKVLALRGPNIWANFPVLEAWVDLQELKDSPSNSIDGFNDRVMAWLPTMIEHRCGLGYRGGFFERLRTGTWMGHILEHVTLELSSLAGCVVGYGRARETSEEGVYKVAIEYTEEEFARVCLNSGLELCLAAVYDRPFDVAAEVKRLKALYENVRLGPSTGSIVNAATARGIPVRRLNKDSLVQLGYGSKQRRICAAETDRTSAIAEAIAQDKELTRQLLAAVGVPVPEGRPVDSAEDAWTAAEEIGVPVVVKPQFGNQGRGVATNLSTREQVVAAYAAARQEERTVVVERFAPGADYRLLVVGDKVIAAARREPPYVIGDGQHTIAQLVDVINQDPCRGEDHATCLSKIPLDEVSLGVLADQGYTPNSIPAVDAKVLIRRNANLSTGGTAADVTEEIHPEVASRAVDAAKMIGLDIAGVDMVALDVTRPLEELRGVIVEVNAAPGLRMHLHPSAGTARPVGEAIIGTLFPEGHNGRIPIAAVTGVNGKTTTTRFLSYLMGSTGRKVAMTCTDGIYIDGRRVDKGDCSGPQSARSVLMNPTVDIAVLETARGGILRAGLGFDLCDVAVVTNIGEGDHLGLSDIGTLEQLAKVKRCIVDVVQKDGYGVLNAEDPLVAAMAEKCPGKVAFFSTNPNNEVVVAHRAQGGRAVLARDGQIILADGAQETVLTSLDCVPLTHGGRIGFQVENTLAAVAAAWCLGLPLDLLRDGVETFGGDVKTVPGRFNLLEINGATVVIDYGHNASSLKAMVATLSQFPHARRTVVYSAAGDRRDEDLIRQGELLAEGLDRVILYEDHYLRGRASGEIMRLFREGANKGGRASEVMEVQGAVKSVETALAMVQPGELLVIQADVVDETVEYVFRQLAAGMPGRQITFSEAVAAAGRKPAVTTPNSASATATEAASVRN